MPTAVSVPQPAQFERVGGTRIHYTRTPERPELAGRPWLVLIHGFAANLSTWDDVLPELESTQNVLRLDLKGFGFSDKPGDDRYDVTDHAALVAELVVQLGLESVVLVGHSYGGAVAVLTHDLLSRREGSGPACRGLVLIAGAGFPQPIPFQVGAYRIPLFRWFAATFTTPEWRTEFTLRRIFHADERITPDRVRRYAYFLDLPGSQASFARVAAQMDVSDSAVVTEHLGEIRVPTLLLWGESDRIVPLENGRRFAAAIPGATLTVLPDCGHAPHEECPEQALRAIRAFLEGV